MYQNIEHEICLKNNIVLFIKTSDYNNKTLYNVWYEVQRNVKLILKYNYKM